MSQFKYVFLSGVLISAFAFLSVIMHFLTISLAIEIGLSVFGLCLSLFYVIRFSKAYGLLQAKEHKLLQQLHKHILKHYANLPPQEMWQGAIVLALDQCTACDKKLALLQILLKDKTRLDALINKVTEVHQETQVLHQLGLRWDKVANDSKLDDKTQQPSN